MNQKSLYNNQFKKIQKQGVQVLAMFLILVGLCSAIVPYHTNNFKVDVLELGEDIDLETETTDSNEKEFEKKETKIHRLYLFSHSEIGEADTNTISCLTLYYSFFAHQHFGDIHTPPPQYLS